MPMNPRILRPLAEPGVLDFAPGAAAAYSLRNLSYTYAGPVVTVRRSTDNAEADFTAAEVSDGTLAGWAGADGFVKQWWDQSGNARHATQATAAAQPQIVDSGVLVTEGGKAAVRFDGTDDSLDANSLAAVFSGIDTQLYSFIVTKTLSTAASNLVAYGFGNSGTNTPARWTGQNAGLAKAADRDDVVLVDNNITGGSVSNQAIVVTDSTMDALALYVNGAFEASGTASFGQTTLNQFSIGCLPRTTKIVFWDGTISELIIYPTDQTALRTRIEGNLAWYY